MFQNTVGRLSPVLVPLVAVATVWPSKAGWVSEVEVVASAVVGSPLQTMTWRLKQIEHAFQGHLGHAVYVVQLSHSTAPHSTHITWQSAIVWHRPQGVHSSSSTVSCVWRRTRFVCDCRLPRCWPVLSRWARHPLVIVAFVFIV